MKAQREREVFFGVLAALILSTSILLVGLGSFRTSASDTIVPPQQSITLFRGYYDYVEIDSFSSNTWLVYNVTSDYPISTALMNLDQLSSFTNVTSDPISNSITYQNGTSAYQDVQLSPGRYFILFYAYSHRATVAVGYYVYPNTPFSYGEVTPPQPTGIAAFGISNDSGVVTPYVIRTNQIVGLANISSFLANNPNASSFGDNVAGATLQLNANLVVNQTNGLQDVYWVQNTPDFVTSVNAVALTDNLWNNTDYTGYMTNQSVTSPNFANGGAVYASTSQGTTSYAYLFNENNATYSLPFSFALVENETVERGSGVLVQFGFRTLQNGSLSNAPTSWYDNVTIHVPDVQSAYFDVAGNATTPVGSFYDAELVFAGEGNFETTQFLNMSASLGLFYQDQSTGSLTSFPSYYSFGGDTGEASTNLTVGYSNGIAYVSVGGSNYSYLGRSSLTLGQNYLLPSAIFNTPNQTEATTTFQSSTTASITTSSSTVVSSNNFMLYLGVTVVVVIVVAAIAVAATRRKRPPEQVVMPSPQVVQAETSTKQCAYCGTFLPLEAAFCSSCGAPQNQT
jgi:thermopsin